MAYIDNFDEETIIDVASQYGAFMNAEGTTRRRGGDSCESDRCGQVGETWHGSCTSPCTCEETYCKNKNDRTRRGTEVMLDDNRQHSNAAGTDCESDADCSPPMTCTNSVCQITRRRPELGGRIRSHINPLPGEDLHRMRSTPKRPTAPVEDFRNQIGNVRKDLGGGFSSFQNRMMSMGCNGLISRRNVLQSKLNRFDEQGIRPAQRIQLQEKIDFINNELQQKGCDLNFSGNNLWMGSDY